MIYLLTYLLAYLFAPDNTRIVIVSDWHIFLWWL